MAWITSSPGVAQRCSSWPRNVALTVSACSGRGTSDLRGLPRSGSSGFFSLLALFAWLDPLGDVASLSGATSGLHWAPPLPGMEPKALILKRCSRLTKHGLVPGGSAGPYLCVPGPSRANLVAILHRFPLDSGATIAPVPRSPVRHFHSYRPTQATLQSWGDPEIFTAGGTLASQAGAACCSAQSREGRPIAAG